MKRLTGILLAVCLLVLSVCPAVGASDYDASIETKYMVLQKLHIMEDEAYGEYGSFRKISKNAFLHYVCNLIDDYGFTEKNSAEAVRMAEERGLIYPGQTNLSKPINYEEAVTVLVRLLGYRALAESEGGFPYGYLSVGNRIGLTKGVTGSGDLEKHEVILLLYNTLNCPYAQIESYTNSGFTYKAESDTTFLYEFRRIYQVEGILESAGKQEIRVDKVSGKSQAMIGGYVYGTTEDISEYIGMKVEAYIREDESGIDKILFVNPLENKVVTLHSRDMISVADDYSQISAVDQNDKTRKYNLSPVVSIVYNGKPITAMSKDLFFPPDGEIRLIDNGDQADYDVVLITSYQTMVVSSIAKTTKVVHNTYQYDTALKMLDLEQGERDEIRIIGKDGEHSFADLKPGDVLRVADAASGRDKVIQIRLSRDEITGTVSSIRDRNSVRYITVDGAEYPLSRTYETALEKGDARVNVIELGGTYVFYLDDAGFVAYVKRTDEDLRYGIAIGIDEEDGIKPEYRIKLYTTGGEFVVYPMAKKIEFDGIAGVKTDSVISRIRTANSHNEVCAVAYKLNSQGVITYLDLPEEYTDGTTGLDGNFNEFNQKSGENALYRTSDNSLASVIYLENDLSAIWVDGDAREEESYTTVGSFVDYERYDYTAYNLDEFGFSDFVVVQVRNTDAQMNKAQLFLVEDVIENMGQDGETTGGLIGATGRLAGVSYYCDPDILADNDVKRGDAISVLLDSVGEIKRLTKYHSADDGITYAKPTDTNANGAMIKGVVVSNDAANYRIKIDCGEYGFVSLRTAASQRVFIYDTAGKGSFYNGTVEDIQPDDFIIAKLVGRMSATYIVYRYN